MTEPIESITPRLLPWTTDDGRPAYLRSDNPDSYLSRMADAAEETQLASASYVMTHARELLAKAGTVGADEYRHVTRRLTECLADVVRIAESRGMR